MPLTLTKQEKRKTMLPFRKTDDGSETADILKHLEEEMEEWITINEIIPQES